MKKFQSFLASNAIPRRDHFNSLVQQFIAGARKTELNVVDNAVFHPDDPAVIGTMLGHLSDYIFERSARTQADFMSVLLGVRKTSDARLLREVTGADDERFLNLQAALGAELTTLTDGLALAQGDLGLSGELNELRENLMEAKNAMRDRQSINPDGSSVAPGILNPSGEVVSSVPKLDLVNFDEELGDASWFAAAVVRASCLSLSQVYTRWADTTSEEIALMESAYERDESGNNLIWLDAFSSALNSAADLPVFSPDAPDAIKLRFRMILFSMLESTAGALADRIHRVVFYRQRSIKMKVVGPDGEMEIQVPILLDIFSKALSILFAVWRCAGWQVFEANIAKLKARMPDKFDGDVAVNRTVEVERKILEQNLSHEAAGN